jgi:predicted Zn-dependent protease
MTLAYSQGQYDRQRLARARADLQAVVDARPQWGEARADLGLIKYYAGEAAEAKADMLQATQMDPTHLGIGIAYAQLLAWSGNTTAAIQEVSRLRRLNPVWSRESARELASSWTQDPQVLANIP